VLRVSERGAAIMAAMAAWGVHLALCGTCEAGPLVFGGAMRCSAFRNLIAQIA
jgi:hypothetical protein